MCCFVFLLHFITLHLFIYLADAFIQSDFKEGALQKCIQVTDHNNEIAPNITGGQNVKDKLWKANKRQWEEP